MSKCLAIVFLLLASFHLGLQKKNSRSDDYNNNGDNGGDDGDIDDDVAYVSGTTSPCSKPVDDLKIYSPSSETVIGENVTLECELITNCLPINYILFLEKNKAKGQATKKKAEEKAVFKLTVSSINELGEYKCKAQYLFNDTRKHKYSRGFNFTLKASTEDKNKLVVFIVAPILLLLLLLPVGAIFPLLILPWCKAKKGKSASNSTQYLPANYPSSGNIGIYDDVEYGKDDTVEYCDVQMKVKVEDCRKEMFTEDTRVTYAEIISRR